MKPMTVKSNIFVEKWSNAQFLNRQLVMVVLVQMGIIVLGGLGFSWANLRPKPIYYITSQGSAGLANPNTLPETAIGAFAQAWLLNWTNFSPSNVSQVYARALQAMSPNLWLKTKQQLAHDVEQAQHNNISSQLSIEDDPTMELRGNMYQVTLKALKNVYVGNQNISSERVIFTIMVKKVSPTQSNPFGLVIDDIDQDSVK